MHVYITGIAGFLGSNLADFYIDKGFKLKYLSDLKYKKIFLKAKKNIKELL